ncbi:phosphoribosylanthranilate isomerase [Hydrogenispora ethanolica]|uniref:N-(5'-phosphoribosyl)anthranilate isomerase n=1 Tax=Hydrogenispora ethanolica TaxID=1082276 RepID=A0A4R1R944_HYDET|nr:phosphoribosylanthranilate isomerase [Hydrogenispora ethanolica]TCL62196.1 phosphoribosylanthranilate isomerase [Hydrogenispora ethanolica]
MEFTPIPRVKICCISTVEEARLAVKYGAAAVGLVGPMPSGPGIIPDERIREIAAAVPPPVATFLLTSEVEPVRIIEHYRRTRTNTIQLVDRLAPGAHQAIRAELPGVKLVQVIHVQDEGAIAEALEAAAHVDALLLDSGNPNLAVKELGGTGRIHNWEISAAIRRQVALPIFLAGGLTPENVGQAIATVGPFGVDVCSGVRNQGKLDLGRLKRFFAAVRSE